MRDHRVDVRQHFRKRVPPSHLFVAEHIVHRGDHKPLFSHLGEQLGTSSALLAALPRAAMHKKVERRRPLDLAEISGQVEVVRLRDVRMHSPLPHLPPAVRKVLAHVRLRALGNLRGGEPKRQRVRISSENRDEQERPREKYDRIGYLFHGSNYITSRRP